MIWVLDSWLWWVLTAEYIQEVLPDVPLLVFADRGYVPYGEKSPERIRERTFVCLHRLFEQWCKLVILACNTASTHAIEEWQARYPDKKVLSVTIPWVEAVIEHDLHKIGVIATHVTAKAKLYTRMLAKHYASYPVQIQELPWWSLVTHIEVWSSPHALEKELQAVRAQFHDDVDGVILWCTHYPLIEDLIRKEFGSDLVYIDPWKESARKLPAYIARHPELGINVEENLDTDQSKTTVVTTWWIEILRQHIATLLGPVANERDCLAVDV